MLPVVISTTTNTTTHEKKRKEREREREKREDVGDDAIDTYTPHIKKSTTVVLLIIIHWNPFFVLS